MKNKTRFVKDVIMLMKPRIIMLHGGNVYFDGTLDEFEKSDSEYIRPYFDMMVKLQHRDSTQTQ